MSFELNIMNMDNAAFAGSPSMETARILRLVAAKIDTGEESGNIYDLNGNAVGIWYADFPEPIREDIE
jgi:hypothetical protein